jgi:peptide/nickel transport system substrate-binding protein
MTIINGSDIQSWDPALTRGTFPGGPMDVLDAIYGFIVYINTDAEVVGSMAESLTSEDAITWTLKLREGVTFTDGNPYDAEAVKYNWDRIANPDTVSPNQAWVASWAGGMTVVDPLTLTITLPAANANFAAQVAELVPFIASPATLEAAADPSEIEPIGAGPFILVSWDQGVGMTLARNPDYWDQPRPYLAELKFAVIPETIARIATVVQGGATMMAGYPHQFGDNNKAPGVTQTLIPMRGIFRGHFNQTEGIFTDVRAREAFYKAIDRNEMLAAFTQTDLVHAATTFFGENSAFNAPQYTFPEYDPEGAQALIDELAAEGKVFDVWVRSSNNSDVQRLATYIQQTLNAYEGVSARIDDQVADGDLVGECRDQREFDICIEGGVLVANGPEPVTGNLLRSTGAFNYGQYNSAEMDAALAAASATVDLEARKAAYTTVQQLFIQDLPLYVFGEAQRYLLLREDTGGVTPSNGGILQKQFLYLCPEACLPRVE